MKKIRLNGLIIISLKKQQLLIHMGILAKSWFKKEAFTKTELGSRINRGVPEGTFCRNGVSPRQGIDPLYGKIYRLFDSVI